MTTAVIYRNLLVERKALSGVAFGVLEPFLYLLSLGVGVGKLVGSIPGLGDPTVTYAQYVGPALMAMAAMNGTLRITSEAVFLRLRFEKTYNVMLATPVRPRHIALAEITTAVGRGTVEGAGFLITMALLGAVHSPWAALDLPAAALVGFAFAGLGMVAATFMRDWPDFQALQLVLLPMFLFATTFYPLSVYPGPLQALVRCLPLYHGINLLREPALGQVGMGLIAPALYLLLVGAGGLWLAVWRIERVLED